MRYSKSTNEAVYGDNRFELRFSPLAGFLCILLGGSPSTFAEVSDPSLVAHYELDGNALDSSGNDIHGTITKAIPSMDRFGNPTGAMSFNGVDAFISANATSLPKAERTVSLWLYANKVTNRPAVLGYGGGTCGTSWFQGLNNSVTTFNDAYYVTAHCQAKNTIIYYATPINTWIHWAITTDATGTKFYINGVYTGGNPTFFNNTDVAGKNLAMGVTVSPGGLAPYEDHNSHFLDGSLDDVRIYSRALTPTEIASLYLDNPCTAVAQASESVRLGTPPNPNAFLKGATNRPILCGVWDPRIDHTTFMTNALVDLMFVCVQPTNQLVPPHGTLLCDLGNPYLILTTMPGVPFSIPIPNECSLVGISISTQGASLSVNQSLLTNAIDVVIGTF